MTFLPPLLPLETKQRPAALVVPVFMPVQKEQRSSTLLVVRRTVVLPLAKVKVSARVPTHCLTKLFRIAAVARMERSRAVEYCPEAGNPLAFAK